MKLQHFIDRPILSMVISVVILVAGLIGLYALSVEQYPDIAPPTIRVSTTYSGANAEAVQKSVIVPLEEAINGVENMTYMTSTASNTGSAEITVYFKQGSDPDMAAVNVQNKVSTATSLLPAEVTKVGVTTMKRQNSMLKIFGLYSPNGTYDETFLTNYLSINVKPQLQRITGVGEVNVIGGDYAMRIWLKPDVMAQYELEPSDVEAALSSQNIEASTGSIGEDSKNVYQYTLKYRGRLEKEQEFEEIVIRAYDDGRVLKLKDIATVELGAQSYTYTGSVNGAPGSTCMVNQTAGTNANEIITNIDKYLESLKETLPNDVEIVELMSTKNFLDASIHEVIKTLLEAIILVVLVVYIFLQNPRSTLIPTVSIFVSLIGTFAALYIAGFSINLLTLFALVLAIGTIVDDAIIVVEAVQVRFDEGYRSPYKASVDAMSGISSAIVTSTLVFMAVFVPVSFMGGTSGVFYTQFGITMAVILSVPFGLMGSFFFARMWGIENNIYLQTGLIMLIGLLSKTAILLTEYATERRKEGMSLSQAAISAAGVRLRPILMTALTMIFGLLPLMFASGVGANGNTSLGVGAVGGMLIGTIALLFVTPAFFITFQYLEERIMGKRKADRKL